MDKIFRVEIIVFELEDAGRWGCHLLNFFVAAMAWQEFILCQFLKNGMFFFRLKLSK